LPIFFFDILGIVACCTRPVSKFRDFSGGNEGKKKLSISVKVNFHAMYAAA